MKDNVLKREFRKNDVQRMRNIITGKVGDKTQTLAGWEKDIQTHEEGDIWEESGKTWTIKNGIKQTVTKLDGLKKLSIVPLCCPKCHNHMKINQLNKKMYSIHGICFDCTIEMEAEIKRQGKWDEYTKRHQTENKNAILEDIEAALDNWYKERETYVTEEGDVQSWSGGNKSEIYEHVKKEIAKAKEEDIY